MFVWEVDMELISQHAKSIMEECKERAESFGLNFSNETLEYVVTNKDLLELSPKNMIPTLYDYWVHDADLLRDKGMYEIYPNNPYETVINTRPVISFYNDNNPDWLNVMIFYHVIAHIDCFQNNLFFRDTWNDDFCGQALANKRLITRLREDMGEESRWVDYVIEFSRGINNLVGYYAELDKYNHDIKSGIDKRIDFYFDSFLGKTAKITTKKYLEEIDKYNKCVDEFGESVGEEVFFNDVKKNYPEFVGIYKKNKGNGSRKTKDLMQYIMRHSEFLNKSKNSWMKQVMEIVRDTSLYFQPQIRTKILNEGWASYWHDKLFLQDDRIIGNEIMYSKINARVVSMPRVGLNPYAIGLRLLEYIHEMTEKGRLSYLFQRIMDVEKRSAFDMGSKNGMDTLFYIRENFNDFMLINLLSKEDFQDFVDRNRLFVAGKRPDFNKRVWKYFVKSRNGEDYRNMLINSLYHPPRITYKKIDDGILYLKHQFEGRPLVREYIRNTMIGIEFLWGRPVELETTEFDVSSENERELWMLFGSEADIKFKKKRVIYIMKDRNLMKKEI